MIGVHQEEYVADLSEAGRRPANAAERVTKTETDS